MGKTKGFSVSLKLNGRKQISLFIKGNTASVNLESVLDLGQYEPHHFHKVSIVPTSNGYKADNDTCLVPPSTAKNKTIKHYSKLNDAINKFVTECVRVLDSLDDDVYLEKPKQLLNLTSYGTPEQKQVITFEQWIRRVIDLYKYNNPNNNPEARTYLLFVNVLNKVKAWDNGKYLNTPITKIDNNTFEAFGNWINNELKGRGYANLMKNFKRIIMLAIENGDETGCTADNKPTFNFKKNGAKTSKSNTELYEEECANAFTCEQIKRIKTLSLDSVNVLDRHNKPMTEERKQIYLDMIKFAIHSAMRPVDLIRLTKSSVRKEKDKWYITYMPVKKNRFNNKTDDERKAQLANVPFYGDMKRIYKKYADASDNDFVFPVNCNVIKGGAYDYARINHEEANINSVLKAIGGLLEVDFKVTLYTIRRSAITWLIDVAKMPSISVARLSGTSILRIERTYHKDVNPYDLLNNLSTIDSSNFYE